MHCKAASMKNECEVNRMGIEVSEDAIKKTTKCRKNISCLSGKEICKVELCIDNKIHFIKCVDNNPCSYKVPFGYSYVCLCPVRKELYNSYKI
jgi:hypothetical protein